MSDTNETNATTKTAEPTAEQVVLAATPATSANIIRLADVVTTTVRKPGDLIKADQFTTEEKQQAIALAAEVDFGDTNTILTFGAPPQRQLSKHLDVLLEGITVRDAGVAGAITAELTRGYNLIRINEFKERLNGKVPGFWSKVVGGAKDLTDLIRNLIDQKKEILVLFEKLEQMADARKRVLMHNNTKFDTLEKQSEGYIRMLAICIAAGEIALLRGAAEYHQRRVLVEAGKSSDVEPANLQTLAGRLGSFEARLLKIQIAYVKAIAVNGPQMKGIRQAGEIEIQNIQDAILFDLTELKHLVLRVAALSDIKQAQEEDEKRRKISKDITDAATGLFDQVYTKSLESQGRGLDDVHALAAVADKVMQTLQKGAQIEQANWEKRAQASKALAEIKDKVQEALVQLRPGVGA